MTLIVPTLMGTISVEADLCITASKERGLDRVQMPALTLIVPHAMGTITALAHCPGMNLNTPSVCSTTSCSLKCCFMYSPLM